MQAYMPEKCIFRAFLLLFAFVFDHEHGNTSLCSALLFIDLTYRIGHFLCEFCSLTYNPLESVPPVSAAPDKDNTPTESNAARIAGVT